MTAGAVAAQVGARPTRVVRSGDQTGARSRVGLIGGAIALYLCLVGIVPVFHARQLITGVISLGQMCAVRLAGGSGAFAATQARATRERPCRRSPAGLHHRGALPLLVVVGGVVDLRAMLLNASPALYSMLTMGLGTAGRLDPGRGRARPRRARGRGVRRCCRTALRRPSSRGLLAVFVVGLFAGLLRTPCCRPVRSDDRRGSCSPGRADHGRRGDVCHRGRRLAAHPANAGCAARVAAMPASTRAASASRRSPP